MTTNLADAFARPDRAAGLKPPPRRAATQTPRPIATSASPRPAPQRPPASAPAADKQAAPAGRLLILLPVPLRDRLRAVAHSRGMTYRDLVLDAIEATIDQLPALLAGHTATQTVNTGLFERVITRPTTPAEGKIQVTIRGLTPQNRRVLDQLVTDTGAASLTELITTALDKHLPARPRAMR